MPRRNRPTNLSLCPVTHAWLEAEAERFSCAKSDVVRRLIIAEMERREAAAKEVV